MADEEIAKVPLVFHDVTVRGLKKVIVALSAVAAVEAVAVVSIAAVMLCR